MTEKEEKELRAKLKPLIIRRNIGLLNEVDFDTALSIITKQQKNDILKSIINNDGNILSITQGLVSSAQSIKADSIIDEIIFNDKIELTYLLSIL
jgi:hypothetical protein